MAFETADMANKAISDLNGKPLDGRNVRIEISVPRGQETPRGGRGGRPARSCFNCGGEGHMSRECPEAKGAVGT